MKKIKIISLIVLSITVVIGLINIFIAEFSDTIIRANGVIMLIALFFTVYTTAKLELDKK